MGEDFQRVVGASPDLSFSSNLRITVSCEARLVEEHIDGGEVEFAVVEAKIGKVVIEGNKYFDEANIRASLPQATGLSAAIGLHLYPQADPIRVLLQRRQ